MSFRRPGSVVLLLSCLLGTSCARPARPLAAPESAHGALAPTGASVEVVQGARLEIASATTPSVVRTDKEQEVVVRVRLHGLPLTGKKRPPLNLGLVLDTSGSMEGAPIEQARAACALLLDLVAEGDTASVVTFGSYAKVIVPAVRITKESRAKAKGSLSEVVAEGTTDMASGLTAGLAQVRAVATPDSVNRLVLVGDGVPNDASPVLALADQAKGERTPVTVLGLGNDFDETLMTALAQRSSGTFQFVDDASRVGSVFKDQISRLDRVVARGARIHLTPGPGVTITEVIGMQAVANGRAQVAQLGDLTEGQSRDVFVRVTTKGRHDGKSMELVDAHVTYAPTEGGAELAVDSYVKLAASSDAARLKDATVSEIEHGVTSLRVAEGTVKAIALARDGDLPNARKLLEASLRLAREGEKKFGDKALGQKVIELTKLRKTIASLAPPREEAVSSNGGAPAPPRMMTPAAASPEEAMALRAVHGNAMKQMQGE